MYQTNTGTANFGWGGVMQAQGWLRSITYRPGWEFDIIDGGTNLTGSYLSAGPGLHLIVKAQVPDSNDPDGPSLTIRHSLPLDPQALADREMFVRTVLQAVIAVETHEAMEYLRDAGRRVSSPHPEPTVVLYHPPGASPYLRSL